MIEIIIPNIEIIEPIIELSNATLAVIMFFLFLSVHDIMVGKLRLLWKSLMVTISLFGVHEIIGILKEFKVFTVTGIYEITELAYIIAFFIFAFIFADYFRKSPEKTLLLKNLKIKKR